MLQKIGNIFKKCVNSSINIIRAWDYQVSNLI